MKRLSFYFVAGALALLARSAYAKPAAHLPYNQTPTRFLEAKGSRYAYRVVGEEHDGVPLLLLQHVTGTMDDWDPELIEGLARHRRIYVFDNAGVGRSGGASPDSVGAMARNAEAFVDALHLKQVDVLGYSLGGFVGQQVLFDRPELVRKAILAGTGPQGGTGIKEVPGVIQGAIQKASEQKIHPKTTLFFTSTKSGQAAAAEFVSRIDKHAVDADPAVSNQTIQAQMKAIVVWGMTPPNPAQLAKIRQPVLVVNGSNDLIVPTENSFALYRDIPTAQLSLYPDSGHGALFQYGRLFVSQVDTFLDGAQ